jgi:hypothetical protein
MEALHWEALARILREQGVAADVAKLRALPHDVELSDRLLVLSYAESAEDRGGEGPGSGSG